MDEQTKRRAVADVMRAILETIEEAGPEGIADGTLYAILMGQGCSKTGYDAIRDALVGSGRVERRNDRLVATNSRRRVDLRDQRGIGRPR